MSDLSLAKVVEQLDAAHRDLARLAVNQAQGFPSALGVGELLESRPLLLKQKTVDFLRRMFDSSSNEDIRERSGRALFACMDLAIEQRTASLGDMLRFYMEHGRMNIEDEKIPALQVIPWLQKQDDYHKRDLMRSDCNIFFRKIINPILLGVTDLTVRTVKERFGYPDYARYCEDKKQISFDEWSLKARDFLQETGPAYNARMGAWVEESLGAPFEKINRYHALRLLNIDGYDKFFDQSKFRGLVETTLSKMEFNLFLDPTVVFELDDSPLKGIDALCVGIDVPGEIHVIMKPVGGLLDLETLLHETGHAFFLRNVSPDIALEYRRFYRSSSLDEAFAFLFMELAENQAWLTRVAGMNQNDAEKLSERCRIKRLCLIRRYIGKFLAEKQYFEKQDLKDSDFYSRGMEDATGFEHEPEGYLMDMESDFYSLDYIMAWSGAFALQRTLKDLYGDEWFCRPEAGSFLREVASSGRRPSLPEVVEKFCSTKLTLPNFNHN